MLAEDALQFVIDARDWVGIPAAAVRRAAADDRRNLLTVERLWRF
jgi:hypothetical protein